MSIIQKIGSFHASISQAIQNNGSVKEQFILVCNFIFLPSWWNSRRSDACDFTHVNTPGNLKAFLHLRTLWHETQRSISSQSFLCYTASNCSLFGWQKYHMQFVHGVMMLSNRSFNVKSSCSKFYVQRNYYVW